MRLDVALVQVGLCESREEAKECISKGYVLVDGVVDCKKTRQVEKATHLAITQTRKFVSRGGDKLEGALLHVYKTKENARAHLEGKTAIDIGASTGGFTDCLLSYGVSSVVAVDVGTGQLHTKISSQPNVLSFENTDIRTFRHDVTFDIVVADMSFISLEKVASQIYAHSHAESIFLLLIKPQFEVGAGNTKKGIVKDMLLVQGALEKYRVLFENMGIGNVSIFACNLQGGDGNQEYFLYGKRGIL